MLRHVLALASMVLATACASPGEPQPRSEWTCAAYCPKETLCRAEHTSISTELVTSKGPTAADAFAKLTATCSARVVSTVSCRGEHLEQELASVGSSCGAH
jgi:hypothetical protein